MHIKFAIGAMTLALGMALAPTAQASTKTTTLSGAELEQLENLSGDLGSLLNSARAQKGAAPVRRVSVLNQVAARHAADMQRRGVLSHRGSDGSTVMRRVKRAGYCARLVSENVAQGWPNDAAVFQGWMASSGHRKNNLNKRMQHYGFARAGDFHVLVFARPC
ncbi:CAP domain-containing protein [Nereida sp. MMG025]|uniref:CAP domain-containing protein n=1 Tax=Nereida sp. MMG025 TaxID=2909981 RepID=UPI001F2B02F9|nr:CAP domain-containing protein [Nereida sp. MMG025]MCF6443941.1 CAP domain-containing protein [Nereida sp. MMG025]